MTYRELFIAYLNAYARMDIDEINSMIEDDVHLRDWKVSVRGKKEALAETAKNFASAMSIEIEILNILENEKTIAGELRILVDESTELFVVDTMQFSAQHKIQEIRAYLGRAST